MKKESLEQRVSKMKLGQEFDVPSHNHRIMFTHAARTLMRAGIIKFRFRTWKNGRGGFTIRAIEP